jgi:hypothetical protein
LGQLRTPDAVGAALERTIASVGARPNRLLDGHALHTQQSEGEHPVGIWTCDDAFLTQLGAAHRRLRAFSSRVRAWHSDESNPVLQQFCDRLSVEGRGNSHEKLHLAEVCRLRISLFGRLFVSASWAA